MSERQRQKRISVAIPCKLRWQGRTIEGWIANLSLTGALVRRATLLPPKGTRVVLHFEFEKGATKVKGKIPARVIHTTSYDPWTLGRSQGIGDLGLHFLTTPNPARKLLGEIFAIFTETAPLDSSSAFTRLPIRAAAVHLISDQARIKSLG